MSLQPSTFTIMFTMKFKIVKTDRRHTANQVFRYYVEPAYELGVGRDERIEMFKELRAWCWEQFGPGCERDYVVLHPVPAGTDGQCRMATQERWAWLTTTDTNSVLRIYFNDDELAWFKLKWA